MNTTMADQLPLVRQWILLRKLCSRHYGVTIKDMVHELGVSEKTIRRDLETFQAAGFPLEGNRWRSLAARSGTSRRARPSRA